PFSVERSDEARNHPYLCFTHLKRLDQPVHYLELAATPDTLRLASPGYLGYAKPLCSIFRDNRKSRTSVDHENRVASIELHPHIRPPVTPQLKGDLCDLGPPNLVNSQSRKLAIELN